jgi:hypothetical protein
MIYRLAICLLGVLLTVCGCSSGGESPEGEVFGFRSSPADGEDGVATTRESILTFDLAVDVDTVTPDSFFATVAGEPVASSVHVFKDTIRAALFFPEGLPGDAVVEVTVDGGQIRSQSGLALDGDGDGSAGGLGVFSFSTVSLVRVPDTDVCARVFASELDGAGLSQPLGGVRISVDGAADTIWTVTGPNGRFCLEDAPAGRIFVHIDGRTATPAPPDTYFPNVGKAWKSFAGERADVGLIHLPAVANSALMPVSTDRVTVVEFSVEQLGMVSDPFIRNSLDGVRVTVPADSLFADDGARGGSVGIAPVPADRLPGALPFGLNFPLVITVQTDGPTNFDEPVPACFMNLPDPVTGKKPAPREELSLWSFNHDTGRFEVVGTSTVNAAGDLACSDPGSGILAPGWHAIADWVTGRSRAPSGLPANCGEVEVEVLNAGAAVGACFSGVPALGALFESLGNISSKLKELSGAKDEFQMAFETLASGDTRRGELRLAVAEVKQAKGALKELIQAATQAGSPFARALSAIGCLKSALAIGKDACDDIRVNALCATEDDPIVEMCQLLPGLQDDLGTLETILQAADRQLKAVAFAALCAALEQAETLIDDPDSDEEDLLEGIRDLQEKLDETPSVDDDEASAFDRFLEEFPEFSEASAEAQAAREADPDGATFVVVETGGSSQQLTSTDRGYYETTLPANTYYSLKFYDPIRGLCGATLGISSEVGEDTDFYGGPSSPCPPDDTDGDGIPDLAESIVGTSITNPDTDGDGVRDLDELLAGTDPGGRTTVQFGELIEGDIAEPGEVDIWRLVVDEPGRLFFDVTGVVVTERSLLFDWRGPDGTGIIQTVGTSGDPDGARALFEASVAGVYSLAISTFLPSDDGSYRFRVHRPVTDEFILFVGEPSEGELERPGDLDVWTFEGLAGQEILFDLQALIAAPGALAGFALIAPSGGLVFNTVASTNTFDSADQGPFTLMENGTYTLQVGIDFFGEVFSYRFVVESFAPAGGGPITIGNVQAGTIADADEIDEWTFDGAIGDRIFVEAMCPECFAADRVEFLVFAPDGSPLSPLAIISEGQLGPFELDQNGEYRVVVRGNGDITDLAYSFIVHAPGVDVAPVTPGVATAGSLTTPGDIDEWTFSATAGDNLFFDELSFPPPPGIVLYFFEVIAPSGGLIYREPRTAAIPIEADRGPDTLPETGTYTLRVRAQPNSFAPLSYSFRITL